MAAPDTNRRETKPVWRREAFISNIPASAVVILLSILVLTVATTLGLPFPARKAPAASPAVIESRIQTEGYDRQKRRVPFTVYVLSQQLSWRLESVTELDGQQTLLDPELDAEINRARDVFCVGTASFEGATRTEEVRAARRAGNLARWIESVVLDSRKTRVFRLSAGQYKGPKGMQSTYQRKAILIATGPHDEGVDLADALKSGLQKKQEEYPVVYSLLHDYSRSDEWLNSLKAARPE